MLTGMTCFESVNCNRMITC